MLKKSILMLLMSVFIQSAGATTPIKIRWILAHQPARVFERAAKSFAKEVESTSQGRIVVEILGLDKKDTENYISPNKVFTMVQKGEVEMCQTYTTYLGVYDKAMWVLDLPYLFKNHDHASRVLDGAIGRKILDGLESTGVKGMAFTYSGGYRIIPSEKTPITKIGDFKGMKIRITDSPVAAAYLKELGAIPIQVEDANHYAKKADAFETTYARLEGVAGDRSQYINETEHSLFLTSILMNKKFFEGLSPDLQKIVKDALVKTAKAEREDSIKDGAISRENYLKKGAKIISLDESTKNEMLKKADLVHEKFYTYFGRELIDQIKGK